MSNDPPARSNQGKKSIQMINGKCSRLFLYSSFLYHLYYIITTSKNLSFLAKHGAREVINAISQILQRYLTNNAFLTFLLHKLEEYQNYSNGLAENEEITPLEASYYKSKFLGNLPRVKCIA